MRSRIGARLGVVACSLAIAASLGLIGAPAASAAVTGSVTCFYGNNAEAGVWVSAGSASGWATTWDNGNGGRFYTYPAISAGTTYRLHVGCGGTPQNWGTTFYSPYVAGDSYDWICTTRYGCYST